MLILYNFWLRFSSVFNPRKQLGRFLGLVFGILFSVFYGLLFGYLFSSPDWEEVDLSTRENFLIGIAAFFFFMTILKGFYPTYQQLSTWTRPFFPLSKFQRYNLKLSSDFASVFFIPAIGFAVALSLMARESLGWPYIIKYIIILFAANIIRRMIQAVLEFRFRRLPQVLVMILLGWAAIIALQVMYPIYAASPVWADLLTFALIYVCGLLVEEVLPFERKVAIQPQNHKGNIFNSLLFQNKKIRSSLLVGFIFKLGILGVDIYMRQEKGEHLFNSEILLWLVASPVLIFNYVYNNLWGYNRALWLTLDRAPNAVHVLQQFYFRMLLIPLLIDFILSTIYFILHPEWTVIGIVSWVVTAIISIVFGFYWSLLKPRLILKTISSKGNTYVWSNVVSMLLTILLYGMLFTKWLYWLTPVYLVVSGLVYYYTKKEYPELRKGVFQELFKE
jgi:hypothetical protein